MPGSSPEGNCSRVEFATMVRRSNLSFINRRTDGCKPGLAIVVPGWKDPLTRNGHAGFSSVPIPSQMCQRVSTVARKISSDQAQHLFGRHMSLITDIQKAAVEKDTDVATLLRKCKLLAARLGSVPLEDWVLHESNGYPDEVPVPAYRKWGTRVVGHFIDEIGQRIHNVTVPPHAIPESLRDYYTQFEYRRSVATAEYALAHACDGMQTLSTGNLRSMLHGKLYEGFQCHEANAQFSNQNLVAMLDAVRNRILDFALALGKIAPDAGEDHTQVEAQRVTQIFNTTIHGSVGVVGNVSNSAINVTANDWASLAQFLASRGVAQTEIDELHDAVTTEPKADGNGLGPCVSKWIGKMVSKAADGSWQIGLGAAGNLLAQALTAYYGLP
jgi:hypothetical protein